MRLAAICSASSNPIVLPKVPQQARNRPRRLSVVNAPSITRSSGKATSSDRGQSTPATSATIIDAARRWIASVCLESRDAGSFMTGGAAGKLAEEITGSSEVTAGCGAMFVPCLRTTAKSEILTGLRCAPQSPGRKSKQPAITAPQPPHRFPCRFHSPSS